MMKTWFIDQVRRFLDGIYFLGFIPVIGDFIGVFLALAVIKTASQVGLPTPILRQMIINVVIDFAVRVC
jgi:ABC-type uncharacterized transport system permease subunit